MKGLVAVVGSRYAGTAVQFALVLVVTGTLSPAETGRYFLLLGMVQAGFLAVGLGSLDGLVKAAPGLVAVGRGDQVRSMALHATRLACFSTLALAAGVAVVVVGLGFPTAVAAATAGWLACYALTFTAAQVLVAVGRPVLGGTVFYGAVNLGCAVVVVPYLLLTEAPSLAQAVTATVVGAGLGAAVSLALLARALLRLHGAALSTRSGAALCRSGWSTTLVRFVQTGISWSPVWVAAVVLGDAEAGLIGLAGRLVAAVGAVLAALKFSARSEIAGRAAVSDWGTIRERGGRLGFWTTSFALAAWVVTLAVGEPVVTAVFGPDYASVSGLVAIMLLAVLVESFGGGADETLKLTGAAHVVLVLQVTVLALIVVAGSLAARTAGLPALAGCYAGALALLNLAEIVWLRRTQKIWLVARVPRPTSTPRAVAT